MWRKKNIWLKFLKNDENYKPIVPRSLTNPKLKKEMATHSSVLAWRIPGTGEPGGLPSMGSHRVGHDWSDSAAAAAASLRKIKKTIPRHIIINLLKSSEKKRKSLKQAEEIMMDWIHKEEKQMTADFLLGTTQTSSHNSYIFKILKNRVANWEPYK